MSKKVKKSKRPNFLTLKRKLKNDVASVSATLADSCVATATGKKLQEAGRIAIINYCSSLEQGLASAFTQAGDLYKDFTVNDLGELVNDCFNEIVGQVRKGGKTKHNDLVKAGEIPPYNANDMGKNASKAIRDKRRDLENLLVCLTSGVPKIIKNARAACGAWVPGQANMAWGVRCAIWRQGVEHLISTSDMTVGVGRGGEVVPGVYYRGATDGDAFEDGDTFNASFGTGKHKYSAVLTYSKSSVSDLYNELGELGLDCDRLQVQCSAGRRLIRDTFIPTPLTITVKEAKE